MGGTGIVGGRTVYQFGMSHARLVYSLLLMAACWAARPGAALAQHDHPNGNGVRFQLGAQAIGLVTHATPAMQGRDLTEGYLSQPAVAAHLAYRALQFTGMLNLEGLTLKRGELNAGIWGEGYMDRRHPHTYLHEAVLTAATTVLGTQLSLSAGRGFAPFGTDDPMVRRLVKYPTNHHLSQILERLVVIGAARHGPVSLEAGVFNGDEPLAPDDLGSLDRFGDSWAARATLAPRAGVELAASYADVTSPEQPFGGGLDHRAWNVAARAERSLGANQVYGLVEIGRAGERSGDFEIFHFNTVLLEGAVQRSGWEVAARFEQSDRPEEERTTDLFRSVRPATDANILGTTEWTIGTLQLSRSLNLGSLRVRPFVEVARSAADPNEKPAIIDPAGLYGSDRMWSFSFGIRSSIGMTHRRMGRYGAGLPAMHPSH